MRGVPDRVGEALAGAGARGGGDPVRPPAGRLLNYLPRYS